MCTQYSAKTEYWAVDWLLFGLTISANDRPKIDIPCVGSGIRKFTSHWPVNFKPILSQWLVCQPDWYRFGIRKKACSASSRPFRYIGQSYAPKQLYRQFLLQHVSVSRKNPLFKYLSLRKCRFYGASRPMFSARGRTFATISPILIS